MAITLNECVIEFNAIMRDKGLFGWIIFQNCNANNRKLLSTFFHWMCIKHPLVYINYEQLGLNQYYYLEAAEGLCAVFFGHNCNEYCYQIFK